MWLIRLDVLYGFVFKEHDLLHSCFNSFEMSSSEISSGIICLVVVISGHFAPLRSRGCFFNFPACMLLVTYCERVTTAPRVVKDRAIFITARIVQYTNNATDFCEARHVSRNAHIIPMILCRWKC